MFVGHVLFYFGFICLLYSSSCSVFFWCGGGGGGIFGYLKIMSFIAKLA